MQRITYPVMVAELERVLLKIGFSTERAQRCARLFSEASLDGVYSHGLNRFPRFIDYIRRGIVNIHAEPVLQKQLGAVEQWDGCMGPGNLNAWYCMDRAMALARQHGMGCVALANTNHWMRGGTYGWQAVQAGLAAVCWTNTQPNMPAWGGKSIKIGNNPLVIALPRPQGALVLDMALSQFSFGKMESFRMQNQQLPVPGGFDDNALLTRNPAIIEKNGQVLPIGFWKGSALSIMLDLLAALLASGLATHEIGRQQDECALSQVFLTFDVKSLAGDPFMERLLEAAIHDLHTSVPRQPGEAVYYPGERTLQTRLENQQKGIPVQPEIWQKILEM